MELQDLGQTKDRFGVLPDDGGSNIETERFYKRVESRFSFVIPNEGSQARDHLANERTFLAYIRTAVNFGMVGMSVIQLFKYSSAPKTEEQLQHDSMLFHAFAKPIGILLTVGALLTTVFGGVRYTSTMYHLSRNKFPVSTISMGTIMLVVVSSIVVLLAAVIKSSIDAR